MCPTKCVRRVHFRIALNAHYCGKRMHAQCEFASDDYDIKSILDVLERG